MSKKMYKRSAQTSTEYLIILSVVIVIALIAVSLLGGFPAMFTSSSGEKTSQAYWNINALSIYKHRISEQGSTVFFRNKLIFPIILHNITIGDHNLAGVEDTFLPTGGIAQFYDENLTCTKGETYAFRIKITYTNADTGLGPNEFVGNELLVGTCD